MSTRPEAGSPDELVWLRGFEEARNRFLAENTRLREALRKITNKVDEALLLDEELGQAWDELRQEVIEARAALEGK